MIVCWLLRSWKEDKTAGIIISPGYVFLEQTTILEVESDTIVRALSKFCRSLRRNKCNPWSQVYLSRQSATSCCQFCRSSCNNCASFSVIGPCHEQSGERSEAGDWATGSKPAAVACLPGTIGRSRGELSVKKMFLVLYDRPISTSVLIRLLVYLSYHITISCLASVSCKLLLPSCFWNLLEKALCLVLHYTQHQVALTL